MEKYRIIFYRYIENLIHMYKVFVIIEHHMNPRKIKLISIVKEEQKN